MAKPISHFFFFLLIWTQPALGPSNWRTSWISASTCPSVLQLCVQLFRALQSTTQWLATFFLEHIGLINPFPPPHLLGKIYPLWPRFWDTCPSPCATQFCCPSRPSLCPVRDHFTTGSCSEWATNPQTPWAAGSWDLGIGPWSPMAARVPPSPRE